MRMTHEPLAMICCGERTETPYANHASDVITRRIQVDGAIPSALLTLKSLRVCVEELVIEEMAAALPATWAQSGVTARF